MQWRFRDKGLFTVTGIRIENEAWNAILVAPIGCMGEQELAGVTLKSAHFGDALQLDATQVASGSVQNNDRNNGLQFYTIHMTDSF